MQIKIKNLNPNNAVLLPKYATLGSAGADICASLPEPVVIKPSTIQLIPTGIAIALPAGFEAQIRPRSGLAAKHGVTVLNSPGTIDSDYRGEIKVLLINHGKNDFIVTPNMRIAQMVIAKYENVSWELTNELEDSARNAGGFGSTGL